MARTLLTVVALQVGWLACVLGAVQGRPWLGPVLVIAFVMLRLTRATDARPLVRAVIAAVVIGAVFDGSLVMAGVLTFPEPSAAGWPLPAWMLALWINFALALDALAWLAGRPVMAALLGAAGGALSYLAGARLGAVVLGPSEGRALLAIAVEWAVALPLLMAVFLTRGRANTQADAERSLRVRVD